MRFPSSDVLLALAFLTVAAPAIGQPLPSCEQGVRHIALASGAPSKAYEVCIRPESTTNLYFDSEVTRMELPGRQRFRVQTGDGGIGLLPVGRFHDGERLPLTVHFKDGADPESATFLLVVHPFEVERQVVVSRQPRTLASYRRGEQHALAEVQQCHEEKVRLHARLGGRSGLTRLIDDRQLGEAGISARDITKEVIRRPGAVVDGWTLISYRAVAPDAAARVRVALEVEVENKGTRPWTPRKAVLVGSKSQVVWEPELWPLVLIPPGKRHRYVVELEAPEAEIQGPFTLKIWGEKGDERIVSIGGVTFP